MKSYGIAGFFVLVAWSAPGSAAPPDGGQDLTATARELSDQALRQYQQGQYDAAIESFMAAFALSNNPGLLFNVAQAYRLKGDCEHARDTYQRYLGLVPETPFKPSLERRIAEMEACLRNRGADAGVAATIATPPAPPRPELSPPKPDVSTTKRAAVWTLRGSAGALLASSAVFGVLALDARRDAENATMPRPAMDAANRYTTDTTLFWIFAASGLACAVISYVVGRTR